MKFTVALTKEAKQDLTAIHEHIAIDSLAAADGMIDFLIESMTILEQFPYAGPQRNDISPGLYVLPKKSYLVVYRVLRHTVQVFRVIHAARDVGRVLRGDPS